MIKRGIYYCGRMISAQYGPEFTESHYEKVKKVYSIHAMVATLKKLQVPAELIVNEVSEKFNLTKDEAEKYLK